MIKDQALKNNDIVKDIPYKFFSSLTGTSDKLYEILGKAPRTKKELAVLGAFLLDGPIPAIHNKKGDCMEHSVILDAIWDSYAEVQDFSVWYAARGTGKTYDLSFLAFLETCYKEKCRTSIIGGSFEQAARAVAYFNEFFERSMISFSYLVNKEITSKGFMTVFGSWVKALAASSKSIRGEHPQKLRIDEADELKEKLYNASLGQPKQKNGHKDNVIVSSTLHEPFGLMSKILDSAGKMDAKLQKWCIHDVIEPHGFWTIEEVKRKKKQVTKEMWETEYECKRPKAGQTIFNFESVDRAYRRGLRIKFEDRSNNEGCIDWGYSCTVLHIVQDMKEFANIPHSYSWENVELTDRCKEIVDICIEKRVNTIYCDFSPKDCHVTLKKIIKKKKAKIIVISVAFSIWKGTGINVIRFYLGKNLINIKDNILQDKMKKYHYKDAEKEIIDKVDDHYPDALIAWAATRWRVLGHLSEYEKSKKEKQERKMINAGIAG